VTTQNGTRDAYDDAMDAEYTPRSNTYFGEAGVDVWHCVLEKGRGKVEFDPAIHAQDRRCTAIKVSIDAFKRDQTTFLLEREMIAESKEWANFVKPSLRALNTDLRALNGKWVQVQTVPTGQKYTNKSGEEKDRTTIKFIAVYPSEAECFAAMDAHFNSNTEPAFAPVNAPPSNGNGAERETAKKFLAPLWKTANGDIVRYEELLKKMSPVNKYFTIQSPEVLEVMGVH